MVRFLQKFVIERFCQWLSGLSRRQFLYAIIVVGMLLIAGELVVMLGSADLLFAYALDLSFYADAAIASAGLTAAARAARVVARLGPLKTGAGVRRVTRARRKRSAADRPKPKPSLNDNDRPPLRYAA